MILPIWLTTFLLLLWITCLVIILYWGLKKGGMLNVQPYH